MSFDLKKTVSSVGAAATGALVLAQAGAARALSVGGNVEAVTPISSGTLSTFLQNFVNIFLWVVGAAALLYLVYGGLLYITAGGDSEKANKGRVAITNAVIGIIVVTLAYVIYKFAVDAASTGSTNL